MRAIRFTPTVYAPALFVLCAPALAPAQTETLVDRYDESVPNTAVTFEMMLVPGDDERGIPTLYAATTELTWDMYDIYLYALDVPEGEEFDAEARPSKPYVPPDRGFGHAGYPAMGMTHQAAEQFCLWLSERTGRHYRLPTKVEWRHLAAAGSDGDYTFDIIDLDAHAWHKANTRRSTQPVAKLEPNAFGLYDVHGNVAEWCGTDDGYVAKGGSYKDKPEALTLDAAKTQDPTWNQSDPQIPKSTWWLADCGFVGMRLVCEVPATPEGAVSENEDE